MSVLGDRNKGQILWNRLRPWALAAMGIVCAMPIAHATPNPDAGPSRIQAVSGFEEPLMAAGATSAAEDIALKAALQRYEPSSAAGLAAFDSFLAKYPQSAWRVSLLANLGLAYFHEGYFSKAIDAWEASWRAGRDIASPSVAVRALTDRAVGELIRMHARLGHTERLAE